MHRDANGDKLFDSVDEACESLHGWTLNIVKWLHFCQEELDTEFPMFRTYRSALNDISNVTQRMLRQQGAEIERLRERLAVSAK